MLLTCYWRRGIRSNLGVTARGGGGGITVTATNESEELTDLLHVMSIWIHGGTIATRLGLLFGTIWIDFLDHTTGELNLSVASL